MAFLGMFTKYQFITWEHKKCYWTSWYYRGYKKSITEQIQIARRKLVEFKRSKEVVPYTGIQEAAFQDVWGAKQHMYITKKKWTKEKIINYWREILLKLHFKALYYQTSLLLKLKRSQYRVAGKLLTENHWNTNKGIYQMCYEQNHPNPAGVEI